LRVFEFSLLLGLLKVLLSLKVLSIESRMYSIEYLLAFLKDIASSMAVGNNGRIRFLCKGNFF